LPGAAAGLIDTPYLALTSDDGLAADTDALVAAIRAKGGTKVKSLKAGTYKVVIHDKATIHGWSLDGPQGFAKDISPVPFVGTKTVTLKLKAGKYKFYCPSHESTMFQHFTVK